MNRIEDLETALDISWAQAGSIRVDPVRRLTGPSLLWNRTGAIVDVYFEDINSEHLIAVWEKHARQVLDALGWRDENLISRAFQGGANLAISAPPDQLYSAIFVAQTAWHFCAAEVLDETAKPFDGMIKDLQVVMAQEANPALISLIAAAAAHDVDILCDDDEVSLGHGIGSRTWPLADLPTPDTVQWSDLQDVPLAFITGTNGKTTLRCDYAYGRERCGAVFN
jgi:cyanophycin synthetase